MTGVHAETKDLSWLRTIDAVLFDMDGTLVDSDAAVERSWTRWAAEYGFDPAAVLAIAHGRPGGATIAELVPDLDAEAVREAAQRQLDMEIEDVADLVALPGVQAVLATLDRRGMPWAVVTSADDRLARVRLGAIGVVPPELVTVEDVRAGKPDPEGYLLAAARLGVKPSRCLVVEDTTFGIEAGRRAGCRVAALRGLPADLTIRTPGELAGLLAAP